MLWQLLLDVVFADITTTGELLLLETQIGTESKLTHVMIGWCHVR
jgi:hypothetical protein